MGYCDYEVISLTQATLRWHKGEINREDPLRLSLDADEAVVWWPRGGARRRA